MNAQLFKGCSLELNKQLIATVWMKKLLPDAKQFSLKELSMSDAALTAEGSSYKNWLTGELKRLFPSFQHSALDLSVNAQSFISEADQYVSQYPSFKMIDHSFYAAMVDGLAHPLRLGADCRIYRLTPYKVQLQNLGQGGTLNTLFLHHPGAASNAGNAAAKQASAASQQRGAMTFEPDRLSNMDVTLQLETGGFHLSWLKPTSDVQAEVKIVDESGITYYETIYDYVDSTHGNITRIPASVLPFGKKLTVTITSFMYLISQEITLSPVEVALEMIETTGFLRNLLHGNSGSQMRIRIPQDKFKKAPRDQWAIVVKTHAGAFKYPVTPGSEWLLQNSDGITPNAVSMVMKGAE